MHWNSPIKSMFELKNAIVVDFKKIEFLLCLNNFIISIKYCIISSYFLHIQFASSKKQ